VSEATRDIDAKTIEALRKGVDTAAVVAVPKEVTGASVVIALIPIIAAQAPVPGEVVANPMMMTIAVEALVP
jgi:hypothetical protein